MSNIDNVKKAQKGNDKAFNELINACSEKLYKIAFAYLKNEQDSLDTVSDTIYKVYKDINKLKNPEFFDTWIIKILINHSINKLNKNKKIICFDEYEKINQLETKESETIWKIPENLDLYNAIDKLDYKLKTIIILKYFQDMTISQISQTLSSPEGTVKVYIQRALKKLKIYLEGEVI